MKLEKITHDHLLTKWLKVIIFSLLMLAPLISVGVRCAYVVCNKNAYKSYYGETINEEIDNYIRLDEMQHNETYTLTSNVIEETIPYANYQLYIYHLLFF